MNIDLTKIQTDVTSEKLWVAALVDYYLDTIKRYFSEPPSDASGELFIVYWGTERENLALDEVKRRGFKVKIETPRKNPNYNAYAFNNQHEYFSGLITIGFNNGKKETAPWKRADMWGLRGYR